MLNNKGNKYLIVFFLLLSTQVKIMISNFQENMLQDTAITLCEIILIIVSLYYIIYKIILKKEYDCLSKYSKKVLLFCFLFIMSYIGMMLYRIIDNNIVLSTSMTLAISLSAMFFIMVDMDYLKYNDILKGVGLFLLIENFYLIILFIFFKDNIRSISVLGNINIYIGVILFFTPIYYMHLINQKKFSLLIFQVVSSALIIILSGSRFAFVVYPMELILFYNIVYNFKISISRLLLIVLICLFGISILIMNTSNYDSLVRALNFPVEIYKRIVNDVDVNTNKISKNSLTRNKLYQKTVEEIKNHPFIGTGRQSVYIKGWGYQGAHNYILEIFLCYGLIGGITYIVLAMYPIYSLIKIKKKSKRERLFLLGYWSVFLFSMVEPLLSSKLVILLLIWGIAAVLLKDKIESINRKKEIN